MDLDAYRTQWKNYTFEDEQGNRFSPIEGLPEALSDVDDTTQVRLGAEYLFLLPEKSMVIPVRAGGLLRSLNPGRAVPRSTTGYRWVQESASSELSSISPISSGGAAMWTATS